MLIKYSIISLCLSLCWKSAFGAPRILNGESVKIADYPYQAEIFSSNNFEECGAVIISKKYLLTAAHCVVTGITYVRIKSDLLSSGGEKVNIKQMIRHPKFHPENDDNFEFDFGLIELEREIVFNKFAQPIPLMHPEDPFPHRNKLVHVTGFGRYRNGLAKSSNTLRHIAIPINEFENCLKIYAKFTKNMFCAGMHSNQNSAMGDSGGPVVVQMPNGARKLIGITSFGSKDPGSGTPGYYGYVPAVVGWIRQVTGDNSL